MLHNTNIYSNSKGDRALDHQILGPKFRPIPNAKKYVFSQFQTKTSQFDKKKKKFFFFFFFWFSIFISYKILQFHRMIEYDNTCFFLSLFS